MLQTLKQSVWYNQVLRHNTTPNFIRIHYLLDSIYIIIIGGTGLQRRVAITLHISKHCKIHEPYQYAITSVISISFSVQTLKGLMCNTAKCTQPFPLSSLNYSILTELCILLESTHSEGSCALVVDLNNVIPLYSVYNFKLAEISMHTLQQLNQI